MLRLGTIVLSCLSIGLYSHAAEVVTTAPRVLADFDVSEYATPSTAKVADLKALAEPSQPKIPPYLGIHCEIDGSTVKIEQIDSLSPAAQAGLNSGDILRLLDGKPISTIEEFRDTIQSLSPGEQLKVLVERAGIKQELTVTLGRPSTPLNSVTIPRVIMGIQTSPNTGGGLKINSVTAGLPAEKAGVQVNDILLKLDNKPLNEQSRLTEALADRRPGDRVELKLKRDDQEIRLMVTLAASPIEGPTTRPSWDSRQSNYFRKPIYRLAVLPITFPDQGLNPKLQPYHWQQALFSRNLWTGKNPLGQSIYGSLNDYYQEISCGKLQVDGKVFQPIELSRNRLEYATLANRNTVLTEAIDLLRDRDGRDALRNYDGIFFLYAGSRAATQRTSIFWPQRSTLSYKGERYSFFIAPEGGDRMASISVIAHEFGHMLGMPDLYAKPEVPEAEGLGVWCTMATGHGQDGKPLHFSAWCKEQMGWLKPTVIDPAMPQKLQLQPVELRADECFKVLVKPDGSEYLLLENRMKRGFDRDLPGEGLLIWRVVDGRPVLEESHGILGPAGPSRYLSAVPYPSKANTAFTPYTTPSSKSVKPNGKSVHITNIRRLQDGRVTFQIGYEYF